MVARVYELAEDLRVLMRQTWFTLLLLFIPITLVYSIIWQVHTWPT
jgi:hypothetical protein